MASQITNVSIVYSTVCLGPDRRKHQSSASRAFVGEIHQWPVNSLHNGPVTRKMFSFDDVIMENSLMALAPMMSIKCVLWLGLHRFHPWLQKNFHLWWKRFFLSPGTKRSPPSTTRFETAIEEKSQPNVTMGTAGMPYDMYLKICRSLSGL